MSTIGKFYSKKLKKMLSNFQLKSDSHKTEVENYHFALGQSKACLGLLGITCKE